MNKMQIVSYLNIQSLINNVISGVIYDKTISSQLHLSGEDAKNFLEPIVKEQENPSPTRLAFIREVLADSKIR